MNTVEELQERLVEVEKVIKDPEIAYQEQRKLMDEQSALQVKIRYLQEKEFLDAVELDEVVTVIGNARNGYRPTKLLAQHGEEMRIEGSGQIEIVELEITEVGETGVIGKNKHGKRSMKGVLIPRPAIWRRGTIDPVLFYWMSNK